MYKYAQIARPLNKLISGENAKKKHKKVEWGNEQEQSFQKLKEACTKTPVLTFADYKKSFRLNTDASELGLGSVLYQQQEVGTFRVIAYASLSLSKTEKNYSAHKLEFLALKWAVTERFHEYLYGGEFEVYTDNNPLTYVLTTAKLDATGQRWIASLANYNFKIHYRSGKSNIDADALSRIPWEIVQANQLQIGPLVKSTVLTYQPAIKMPHLPNAVIATKELIVQSDYQLSKSQWREEQMADVSINMVLNLFQSEQLSKYNCKRTDPDDFKGFLRLRKDLFLDSGLLYRKAFFRTTGKQVNQFVMPTKFRKRTVMICHEDYGHLGMDRVLVFLQERYFWPKMSEDVRKYIRQCDRCVQFKKKKEQTELYPITATYPLELVHLDFLSIGGKDDKMKSVLVVTDHFTRYAQCYVTKNQTALTVATELVNKYFTTYEWPDKILTDRGTSFENELFHNICELAKIKKLRTGSYRPQTNGQCERFNHPLLNMLGTLPNDAKRKWQDWVPTLTHAYNCTTLKTTGFSPYFLIYGQQPRLPIDIEYGVSLTDSYSDCKSYAAKLEYCLKWAYEAAQKYIDKETTRYKKYYDKNFRCATLRDGDLVLIQVNKFGTDHKIADKWEQDPWEVLSQRDNSPLLTIKNVTINEIHELHRNVISVEISRP